jgi:hypothetical protein
MKSRSELKREYKESAPAMGVFVIRNIRNGRFLLHATRNLKGGMNRLAVEITPSTNPNLALRRDWESMGREAFEIRVLDVLEPKDAPGWDPTDDLEQLRALWHARLVTEGGTAY